MTTFRIMEAIDERTGTPRYWVFRVENGLCSMLLSNVPRRRALTAVFDQVTAEDIVELIQTAGLRREEFGVEFRARLAPYLLPHE